MKTGAPYKLLYRIEHSISRFGIYHHYGDRTNRMQKFLDNSQISSRHPGPNGDTKLKQEIINSNNSSYYYESLTEKFVNGNSFYYGFENITQLRSWLPDDELLVDLHDMGFKLVVYKVPEVYYGNCQTAMPSKHHTNEFIKSEKSLMALIKKPRKKRELRENK